MMQWFGEPWGAPVCGTTPRISTPVGRTCPVCGAHIQSVDQGLLIPYTGGEPPNQAFHLDCFLRMLGLQALKEGDVVKVFPHGSPEQGALATVVLAGGNASVLIVTFDDKPDFATFPGGLLIDSVNRGISMMLRRESVGPWIEFYGGGHYEIERYPSREDAKKIVEEITKE